MRSIDVAELKASLSTYVALARRGEEIVVCEKNRPVAKLLPYQAIDATEGELDLVAAGKLRLPEKRIDWDVFERLPKPTVSGNSVTQALLDDREESL